MPYSRSNLLVIPFPPQDPRSGKNDQNSTAHRPRDGREEEGVGFKYAWPLPLPRMSSISMTFRFWDLSGVISSMKTVWRRSSQARSLLSQKASLPLSLAQRPLQLQSPTPCTSCSSIPRLSCVLRRKSEGHSRKLEISLTLPDFSSCPTSTLACEYTVSRHIVSNSLFRCRNESLRLLPPGLTGLQRRVDPNGSGKMLGP